MSCARFPTAAAAALCLMLALGVSVPASAQETIGYRNFVLGSSVAAVSAVTRSAAQDVTVLHHRPHLIQEIAWRPRYTPVASFARDPARDVHFRFVDDQLFSVLVRYDEHEIKGLTAQDLVSALSDTYGTPGVKRGTAIASWDRPGTRITLAESSYPTPFELLVVATALEPVARAAILDAERLDRLEAPAREARERARDEARRRADDAATRERNKAAFRP